MNNVKVKRTDLLTKLQANRTTHRDIFLKAQEGYRKQIIEELDRMIADARNGKSIRRSVSLPEPEDHTSDYDRVIEMLTMSVDNVIEMDSHEFNSYVMDNWAWKAHAMASNMLYTQHP